MGDRPRAGSSVCSSSPTRPARSSRTSATASSGCSASSRSSRCIWTQPPRRAHRRHDGGGADRAVGRAQGVVARRRAPERRAAAATGLYLTLRSQGERLPGLLLLDEHSGSAPRTRWRWRSRPASRRHRSSAAADALQGRRPADRRRAVASDPSELERTIEELAELELASRGGGTGAAGEDTAALLAIKRVAA